eukprot:TRINITY_DN2941_c0_g1_i1.p1 TRINITY_DN2941_c0_g1~~TRINITY_DN2941_c0_g1_i1.p1  ORF type:complete len:342 (+),score=48.31 TRINITY_DN2941_c0_g1_i1:22-1047(+)
MERSLKLGRVAANVHSTSTSHTQPLFSLTTFNAAQQALSTPTHVAFPQAPRQFDCARFKQLLRSRTLGRTLHYEHTVTSTMDVASTLLAGTPVAGTLILAEHQTHSRGRKGRAWKQQGSKNLSFTFLYKTTAIEDLYKLNFATAISVARVCNHESPKLQAGLKWPNDVWIDGKKVAGVLLDSSMQGRELWASVGVGINVNESMHDSEVPELRDIATSVSDALRLLASNEKTESERATESESETTQSVDREAMLARFCEYVEEEMDSRRSLRDVVEQYQRYEILLGKTVCVMPKGRESEERVDAVALRYTDTGTLVVRLMSNGQEKELVTDEVSIRPAASTL